MEPSYLNCVFSHQPSSEFSSWQVDEQLVCTSSYICFLKKTDGQRVLLKQIREEDFEEQLQIIMDVLGSEIAETVGVPCCRAQLVNPSELTKIKPLPQYPAALLTLAPGIMCSKSPQWQTLTLQLKTSTDEPKGLYPEVIDCISSFPELAKIVALDIYLGNTDRIPSNLFHSESRGFTAIDLGESFKADLCSLSLNTLASWTSKLGALDTFLSILSALISHWPENRILCRYEELKAAGGFCPGGIFWNQQVEEKDEKYREIILSSIKHARQLNERLVCLSSPSYLS
jgi:hypothetical protein